MPVTELSAGMQAISYALHHRRPRTCQWGELGISLVFSLLGYILFTMFEIFAKRRGTLEVF
jgi:hypothetical protein